MVGKVPPDLLRDLVVSRTGARDDRVHQGPAYGEDTAAISLGEETLVVNSDPLSLAADRVGTLGVNVACNDVAASGARPSWLTNVVFLPDEEPDTLDRITEQVHEAAVELGVAVVGGHAEYDLGRARPTLVFTCLGLTDRYVPTGGADPGDTVLLTGSAGIEATAILATDFRDLVAEQVPESVIEAATGFYDELSVVAAGAALADRATAMHDPTEGGLVDGLLELAAASGVALDIDEGAIPVRNETAALCGAAGVDPLRTFGSGALVATVPPDEANTILTDLRGDDIAAAEVGTVVAGEPRLDLGDERITEPVRDEMYALWE